VTPASTQITDSDLQSAERKPRFRRTKKVAYWAAFMSLGPISGPLAEGVYRNARKGEWVLSGLYGLAVVTSYIAIMAAIAHYGESLIRQPLMAMEPAPAAPVTCESTPAPVKTLNLNDAALAA
jgi:hypothetical protein